MKKLNWYLLAMLLLLMPALQSCDDDDDGYPISQTGTWATVRVLSGDTYYFESDSYGSLLPVSSSVYGFKPVDGKRMLVFFNPVSGDSKDYDMAIRVEHLVPILTKSVEDLTAENEKDFGNDPIFIYKKGVWIANGYLNVIFRQNTPNYSPHLVSLVRNTLVEPEDDGYIHLEFRYNNYGDLSGWWEDGAVSYNLNTLSFEGKKGIKLKINSSVNGEGVEVTLNVEETTPTPEVASKLDYNSMEIDNLK